MSLIVNRVHAANDQVLINDKLNKEGEYMGDNHELLIHEMMILPIALRKFDKLVGCFIRGRHSNEIGRAMRRERAGGENT
jgi:hypothetical protein